jgi:hypothetical protein
MGNWSERQLAAVGAVVAAVLFVVGFGLFGSAPSFDSDGTKIFDYFHSHHKRILIATILLEIGFAILAVVIAQLAVLLRDGLHRALAAVAYIAGAASVGMLAVSIGLYGGLAQLATFGQEAGAIAPLYRLVQFMQVGWYWVTMVLVLTVALASRKRTFGPWYALVNGLIALLLLLGGLSVKGQGVLQAGTGALATLGGIAFVAWILHLSLLFWRPVEVTVT